MIKNISLHLLNDAIFKKLPKTICNYIQNLYPDGFINEIQELTGKHKEKHYKIRLTENELIHIFEINEEGKIRRNGTMYRFIKRKNRNGSGKFADGMN